MSIAKYLVIFCLVPGSLLGAALALCAAGLLARAGLGVAADHLLPARGA